MVSRTAVLLFLLVLTACQESPSTGSQPANTPSPKPSATDKRLSALEEKVTYLELQQGAGQWIHLDCTKPDFGRLLTDIGTFLVSCEDATPHLGGFKLTLSIGNPWAVTYKGLDVTLTWSDNLFDPPDKLHRSTISLTQDFPPGTWTTAQVVIAPASVNQLRTLSVSIEPNEVSLRKVK